MALQDLLSALRAQAAERRAEVLAHAQAEAERIHSESAVALERRRTEFVEHTREAEKAIARRAVSRARGDAARRALAARDRLLERVRTTLEQRASEAADDPEYRRALVQELRFALEHLPPGPVSVRASAGLVPALSEATAGDERVTVEEAQGGGTGFVALAQGDDVELDATLEARIDYAWPRLAVATLEEVGP